MAQGLRQAHGEQEEQRSSGEWWDSTTIVVVSDLREVDASVSTPDAPGWHREEMGTRTAYELYPLLELKLTKSPKEIYSCSEFDAKQVEQHQMYSLIVCYHPNSRRDESGVQ